MKQEANVRGGLPDGEARRAALDKEKAQISADQASMQADRAALDDTRDADAVRARVAAFTAKAEDLNKRVGEFEMAKREGRSRPPARELRA